MQTLFPLGVSMVHCPVQQLVGSLPHDPPLAMQLPESGVAGVMQKLLMQLVPAQQLFPQTPPQDSPSPRQVEADGFTQQNMSEPASPWL